MALARVGVIQAGFGNSSTIVNMLRLNGSNATEVRSPAELGDKSHVILPGVGNWGRAISLLRTGNWFDELNLLASKGTNILGVCLGMQLLGTSSHENAGMGLGLINFEVESVGLNSRVTNVGWKKVVSSRTTWNHEFEGPYYFTHSYCVPAASNSFEMAVVQDAPGIVAVINSGNVWGAQFHPERSGRSGANFLMNFVNDGLKDA
jgi:glutamine amidotransferase